MRPINKGNVPQENGIDKTVADYKDWRSDLIDRIGNYCCYCNIVLNDSPQVEHVIPKNPQPGQVAGNRLGWENMLLACGACNRVKSNKPCDTITHYLPDYHNTHLAFTHLLINHPRRKNQKACILIPRNIVLVDQAKAVNTIELCQLHATRNNKRATDLRWKYRFEAWLSANEIWRKAWDKWGSQQAIDFSLLLVDAAKAKGFFSVWYEAFYDAPAIKQALINGFIGTDGSSFQNAAPFNPQCRNPVGLFDL